MNIKASIFTVISIAALTAGCEKQPTTTQQIETLKTDTKEAAQDLKDYTFAQKSEYADKMKAQLAEINKDLDALAARIEKADAAAKVAATPKLLALREKEAQLRKQLDEVNNATESTWDTVKAGTRKAFESLKEGFQESRQWLSDKIAP